MDFDLLFPLTCAAAGTAVASALLVRLAPRIGWVDGGSEERKRDVPPLPLVGGAAVLCGWLAGWLWFALSEATSFVPGRALREIALAWIGPSAELWPLGGLLVAFAVGTIDDVLESGLRPAHKLVGQVLAGCVVGLPMVVAAPASAEAWGALAALGFMAAVALNAVNTFDNADGAASGLGVLALAAPAPWMAAAVAAFLPWNLGRGARTSRAILGDGGSHALGMALLITPAAWPVLVLPLLDLARLCWLRLRLGNWPWEGDRRHLAHRLQRAGLSPLRVACVLGALALPGAVCGWWGAPLTALALFATLRATPEVVGELA